jgi:DNA repair protein RecO (recombination protein O)
MSAQPDEQATGIILRVRPLTETSLIVEWLTLEAGRISCVAKGARRAKSPFAGKLDLLYEGTLSFQRSRRSELHMLKEVVLRDTHPRLRESLPLLHAAAYMTILIEQGTERETPLEEFYALLREALNALPAHDNFPGVLLWSFELKFLSALGVMPDLAAARLSPGARALAARLLETSFPAMQSGIAPEDPAPWREINQFLRSKIGIALQRLPPQREKALGM